MLIKGADGRVIEGIEGKLKVLATGVTRLHEDSLIGRLYVASTVDQAPSLTGTAAREVLMTIQNNEDDKDLIIESLQFGSAASVAFILHRNPTIGALGANVAGVAHSLNFGQNKVPNIAINIWNEVAGGITGVTVVEDIKAIFNGVAEHDDAHGGGILLPPGTAIGIDKGATATEVSVSVVFSLQPSGLLTPVP